MLKLIKGFRDFILRGNVIDLAVGIVIGAAFTGLVTGFTNSFLQPLIKAVGGGHSRVTAGTWRIGGQDFLWAAFLNQLITFVLTAAVLYFLVVVPMNTLSRRRNGQAEQATARSDEVALLTEIRDALVAQGLPQQRAAQPSPSAPSSTSTPAPRQAPAKAQPAKAQPAKARRR
jgi:large conductance mechanosensitive channel